MPEQPTDTVRVVVQKAAVQTLADLQATGVEPQPESVVLKVGTWTVAVIVSPSPAVAPVLNSLDQRCLAVVAVAHHSANQAISAATIRRSLKNRNLGTYSESTVKRSLKRLRALGLVGCRGKRPGGHFLITPAPLFDWKEDDVA